MTALIDRAVHKMRAGADRLEVWGDPKTVRDLLYVDDQIEAILAADDKFSNTIINCTANQPVTIGEVVEAIHGVLGWEAEIYYPPESYRGAAIKSLDSSKFLSATIWNPRVDLRTGIAAVLAADYEIGDTP